MATQAVNARLPDGHPDDVTLDDQGVRLGDLLQVDALGEVGFVVSQHLCHDAVPRLSELYAAQWPFIPVGSSSIAMNSSLGKPLRANREDCVKLDPDRPARTLKSLNPGSGFATVVHWSEKRSLTIPEAKRLQSFPDDFMLTGKYIEQWARIGNSVPPLLTKAIARHIHQSILQPLSTVSIEV